MAEITFYHAPQSRSSGVKVLLEELGAPYDLRVLDLKAGEQREPAFLAVNPLGKVPALVDRGHLVTEQPAIFLHLADRFPAAGLAPALDDPLRGPYLRWMVFYGSAFEPAVTDHAMKRDPGQRGMSPYGDFDSVLAAVNGQLRAGPFMLGMRFSALDVLWGMALTWTVGFGVMPKTPEVERYIAAFGRRPATVKVMAEDAALAAATPARPT